MLDVAKLDEAALQALCDNAAEEGLQLDFKGLPPGKSDADKAEFTKDVSAMANVAGGVLLFGIEDDDGRATRVAPIDTDIERADQAIGRLTQVAESGIEPRIRGLEFRELRLAGGGYVLALRVPRSFIGPHRAIAGNRSRFYYRTGRVVQEMSYEQLRTAFVSEAQLSESLRSWRMDRLARIAARDTPRRLFDGPLAVVHLVPLASATHGSSFDVRVSRVEARKLIATSWLGGVNDAINLDGVLMHLEPVDEREHAYCQIFRSGRIEFARSAVARVAHAISTRSVANDVRDFIAKGMRWIGERDGGPTMVAIAVLNVRGVQFPLGGDRYETNVGYADRDSIVVPEIVVEAPENPRGIEDATRDCLDLLWQGFGSPRCLYFDEAGQWIGAAT